MPHIVDELGNKVQRNAEQPLLDTSPDPSVAWTMDPFAPVPEEYKHLVQNPNESESSDEDATAQKEEQ